MPRFGLKLGAHEKDLAVAAEKLWRQQGYDFLELYVLRDVDPGCAALWKWYDGVLVLHAPHAMGGFNFARPEMAADNAGTVECIEAFRERMNPDMVIFHPGLDGDVEELFRQVSDLRSGHPELHSVMLLENKPRLGLGGEHCLGSSPEEMRDILHAAGCGFCLDIRHAFAYSAWAGREWRAVLRDFAALNPRLWHAADGDAAAVVDSHLHIGEGSMPWDEISEFWDRETPVTIECVKERAEMLDDFRRDMDLLCRRTARL